MESAGPHLLDPHKTINESAGHVKIERLPSQTSATLGQGQNNIYIFSALFCSPTSPFSAHRLGDRDPLSHSDKLE